MRSAGSRSTFPRVGDCWGKKRFTAFHEVEHTFLPGFSIFAQYRCDPVTPPDLTRVRDPGNYCLAVVFGANGKGSNR